jgi:phosphoribosylaminoimidazole (AIR) synthetase
MRRTFNMGLGMIIVVPADAVAAALAQLQPWGARVVGDLVPRDGGPSSRFVGE